MWTVYYLIFSFFFGVDAVLYFLSVLNAKKAKLRAVRDREVEEVESTENGESSENGRSDNGQTVEDSLALRL